jgi:tetratricopeptide (TPR) repeat protein
MEGEALENLWFAARYRNLPPVAEEQLRLASRSYSDDPTAEMHLALARAIAPANPVVLVGEYRYYFYKNRLSEALKVAERCLDLVAEELHLPPRWQDVLPQQANFSGDDAAVRFYLFVLKAYAYLLLRLNYLVEGAQAAEKLMELDPGNKIGGQVLRDVLDRVGRDDYDD